MEVLSLALIGFFAALTPGPDIFYVVTQGLCRGRKAALWAVLGILSGNVFYLMLAAFLGATLASHIYFQIAVSLFGGIYLFKIAFDIWRSEVSIVQDCSLLHNSKIFKEALFVNLSNPKALLFFTIVIAPFMDRSLVVCVLALFFGIASAFVLAALFSSAIKLEAKFFALINRVAALLFILFSLLLLYNALSMLMEVT